MIMLSHTRTGFSYFIVSLCLFLGFIALNSAMAQEVKITNIKRVADNIEVYYNIIDEKTDHAYSLQLYASTDNFVQPLQQVEGDVGIDIKVGDNKKIIWNAKEELGADFDGKVKLELKGSLYVPFISIEGLEEGTVFKRGAPKDLTWSGGRGDNVLNFELYKGDNVAYVFEERPNIGNTTITIPSNIKPGHYKFRISDSRNKDEVVFTQDFLVKRKVPLGVKVGVGVVVGAVVGYLAGSGTAEEDKIGEPPLPTR